MTRKTKITKGQVEEIAILAHLEVTEAEKEQFAKQFSDTLEVVDQLKEVNTENVDVTAQVTGLKNVWREDVIDESKILSQDEALSQVRRQHGGYVVVGRVIE